MWFESSVLMEFVWIQFKNKSDVTIRGIGMTKNKMFTDLKWFIPYFNVLRTVVYNKRDPIQKFP